MEFAKAERWLAGLVNAERPKLGARVPARFSLAPIRALLARVGNPQHALPALHIAGSKGKGSTALFAEALLAEAGLRVGVFTSPHLTRWTERFRVDGAEVSEAALARALTRLRPSVDALRKDAALCPSFFDATTAAAFLLFAEARVDCAVFEVGLGGRLDSTNVCEPLVTCVTSIELEHTEQLGTTLAAIAMEKAGIAKARVPLVTGALAKPARAAVRARAREVGAPLLRAGAEFHATESESAVSGSGVHYWECGAGGVEERGEGCAGNGVGGRRENNERGGVGEHREIFKRGENFARAAFAASEETNARKKINTPAFEAHFTLAAPGAHQVGNAALALCSARQFVRARGLTPRAPWEQIARRALARARLPGRVEIISRAPWLVVDSAHTKASARALAAVLAKIPRAHAHFVLSVSAGKDLDALIAALAPHADTRHRHPRRAEPLARAARNRRRPRAPRPRAPRPNRTRPASRTPRRHQNRAPRRPTLRDRLRLSGGPRARNFQRCCGREQRALLVLARHAAEQRFLMSSISAQRRSISSSSGR